MSSLQALANLIKYKLGGTPYHHSLFRVGMVMTPDPTPFILAAGATKVADPSGAGSMIVTGVGALEAGGVSLTRLYIGEDGSFLQLGVSPEGNVQECRYFSRVDQELPPDEDTWDVWLSPSEGLIGWAQFQTLDGQLYDRQWQPGLSRVEPIGFDETISTAAGKTGRSLRAMLYARATGLTEPAPQTEYLLVAATEQGNEAWVDIHAGIDLNPAALTLA